MKPPIEVAEYTIKRASIRGGWVKLCLGSSTIGLLEPDKLMDDLPRVIGRPLTAEEQSLLSNNIPKCVA